MITLPDGIPAGQAFFWEVQKPSEKPRSGCQSCLIFRRLGGKSLGLFDEPIGLSVDELAVFHEVLPQQTFALEAALFQHARRGAVRGKNMSGDLAEFEVLEGMLTDHADHRGHDALPPERLRQPIANLCAMRTLEPGPF